MPILTSRLFDREMVGADLLAEMGSEVYGEQDATQVFHIDQPMRIRKRGPSYLLQLRLPFVDRSDLDVHRKGEELFVRVGSFKRNLILPLALQRLDVHDASFVEDRLEIRFGRTAAGTVGAAPA